MMLAIYVILGLSTTWIVLGVFCVLHATRTSPRPTKPAPPVSVLKPLCGCDSELEANLESFFAQDYPHFELVFGVTDPDDPAIFVVQEIRQRYPRVPCKLVVHSGGHGINPKVDNLCGMVPHASHDLLLASDSNVRAPAHYVREMVDVLCSSENVGLVTNLFAGTGERSLGAALENVQLNGFCAAGAALPTLAGDALVIGKSMLLSRRRFDALGGFERVLNVLAEDFVIGKMHQHAGDQVRIAPTVLSNVTGSMSVRAFFARQLRWSMLRWKLRPFAAALEPVTSPLVLLPAALAAFGAAGIAWTMSLMMLRDVGGWIALRGYRNAWIPALLGPVRELCMLAVWLRAPFKRHVIWRGNRVRLGAGTLLFAPPRAPVT